MAAHRIPYLATASVAYPEDLFKKVKKAKEIKGTRFFHIFAPCPTGWKSRPEDAVKLARLAVQNGIFPVYEVENGEKYTQTIKVKDKKPIDDYFKLQGRFRHLKPADIQAMQAETDKEWERILKKAARLLDRGRFSSSPEGECGPYSKSPCFLYSPYIIYIEIVEY